MHFHHQRHAMTTIDGQFTTTGYPPFPSGLPTVELETFRLAELENGDAAIRSRLFDVCKARGFFYLYLRGSTAGAMEQDSESIARLAQTVFELPLEEKLEYPMKDSIFG